MENQALITIATSLGTATLHEAAGQSGALPSAIAPIVKEARLCGPAVTIQAAPGDNLWLHRGLAAASKGDVLVVDVCGAYEFGYWGGVMTAAAVAQQLGGLVIDGCVRDRLDLEASGFSVWARGLCIQGTKKQAEAPGAINERLTIGGVSIEPGDLVVGDADGVVVIAAKKMADVIAAAEQRETKEKLIVQELQSGRTTLDVYGWK